MIPETGPDQVFPLFRSVENRREKQNPDDATQGYSCDLDVPSANPEYAGPNRSRVVRSAGPGRWRGVPETPYKTGGEHWQAVLRTTLVGAEGEQTSFHVRYFEIGPGGFSTCERHVHEHVVIVLRGEGECILGKQRHRLAPFDMVYVAPRELHQFRNDTEFAFGFLCVVDADRDRPTLEEPV